MEKNAQAYHKKSTTEIKLQRKIHEHIFRKKKRKNFYNNVMKPGDAVSRIFTDAIPINTGDPFLDEKSKLKLLLSSRAFSRKPNGTLFFTQPWAGFIEIKNKKKPKDKKIFGFLENSQILMKLSQSKPAVSEFC